MVERVLARMLSKARDVALKPAPKAAAVHRLPSAAGSARSGGGGRVVVETNPANRDK